MLKVVVISVLLGVGSAAAAAVASTYLRYIRNVRDDVYLRQQIVVELLQGITARIKMILEEENTFIDRVQKIHLLALRAEESTLRTLVLNILNED